MWEIVREPLKLKFASSDADFQACFEAGEQLGKLLLEKAKQ